MKCTEGKIHLGRFWCRKVWVLDLPPFSSLPMRPFMPTPTPHTALYGNLCGSGPGNATPLCQGAHGAPMDPSSSTAVGALQAGHCQRRTNGDDGGGGGAHRAGGSFMIFNTKKWIIFSTFLTPPPSHDASKVGFKLGGGGGGVRTKNSLGEAFIGPKNAFTMG